MQCIPQRDRLRIFNLDKLLNSNAHVSSSSKNGNLLPHNIRSLVLGPSGCGKTNIVFNLLFHPNGVKFENIYVYSNTLHQIKYKFLRMVFNDFPEINYKEFDDNQEVPHPKNVNYNSVFIFDDISCEKQNNIKNYFTLGRHNQIDTFYISQTYTTVPKQLIRDNANFIIVFTQDDRNLQHIYNDHVPYNEMKFEKFRDICNSVWNSNTCGFLVIDKTRKSNNGRYRKGIDTFIQLDRNEIG